MLLLPCSIAFAVLVPYTVAPKMGSQIQPQLQTLQSKQNAPLGSASSFDVVFILVPPFINFSPEAKTENHKYHYSLHYLAFGQDRVHQSFDA